MNKIKVATPTQEQIEFVEAEKTYRIATAKARLISAGIEPSKISKQAIDKMMRIFDETDRIQKENQLSISELQMKIRKAQQEGDMAIHLANQEAQQKFNEIQKRFQDMLNSLKEDKKGDISTTDVQTQEETIVQSEQLKEEIRERTREELVAEVTEKILEAFTPFMKGPIAEKVNEFMSTINKKTIDVVAQGPVDKENESQSCSLEHKEYCTIEEPTKEEMKESDNF